MHYEQYFQVATKEKFLADGISESDLLTCRKLKQQVTYYENIRNIDPSIEQLAIDYGVDIKQVKNFNSKTGMIIRHLEFSNGNMQNMWIKAIITQDFALVPFKKEELEEILANEPQEEV